MKDGFFSVASTQFKFGSVQSNLYDLIGEQTLKRIRSKFPQPDRELWVALRELIRFLYLSAHSPKTVFFPGNKLIDELWHAMIVETADYREFCNRLSPGVFIEHSGITFDDYSKQISPQEIHEEQMSWLASYVHCFGPIDEESFACLPLAISLAERSESTLDQLNELARALIEVATNESPLENFNLEEFIESQVKPAAHSIDSNRQLLGRMMKRLVVGIQKVSNENVLLITNDQLEKLFGSSAALAFTFWQHLAAVERLSGIEEWQARQPELWAKISRGDLLCGLATTHLAKPGGGALSAANTDDGYLISGTAHWVCGDGLFDLLLVGFENNDSIVFAVIDFPSGGIRNQMVCLNGTATARIEFKNFFIPNTAVISHRKKDAKPPAPRPSRYTIPELGIAKEAIARMDKIVSSSTHPRHIMIAKSLPTLIQRVNHIDRLRLENRPLDELMPLRDEVNRDAVRLLTLMTGAAALKMGSIEARLTLELMLLDCVVQSPSCMENKILKTSAGVHA